MSSYALFLSFLHDNSVYRNRVSPDPIIGTYYPSGERANVFHLLNMVYGRYVAPGRRRHPWGDLVVPSKCLKDGQHKSAESMGQGSFMHYPLINLFARCVISRRSEPFVVSCVVSSHLGCFTPCRPHAGTIYMFILFCIFWPFISSKCWYVFFFLSMRCLQKK